MCSTQGPLPTWKDASLVSLPVSFLSPSSGLGHLYAGRNPLALFSLVPNPPVLVWPQTPVWSPLRSVREEQCLELA